MVSDPKFLLLDTTLGGLSLGFGVMKPQRQWQWVDQITSTDKIQGSEKLPLITAQALSRLKWDLNEIGGVVVGHGPGSFTGIRVSLSFVEGLLHGADQIFSVRSVSPLLYLAKVLKISDCISSRVTVILPSTRTHGFVATLDPFGQQNKQRSRDDHKEDICLLERDVIVKNVSQYEQVYLIESQWSDWRSALLETERLRILLPEETLTLALEGLKLAAIDGWPAEFSKKPLAPLYLRLSTAEEQRRLNLTT